MLRDEIETIFRRGWICVGRAEQAPEQGDFFTRDWLGESLLLVRGSDDRLRAYHNACRHRGTRLCEGNGHAGSRISCPYHAWTYRIDDGALVGTPNVSANEGLDRGKYSLMSVRCDEWQGFVFVNFIDNGCTLHEWLQGDPEYPTQFERFRLGELRTTEWSAMTMHANWKIGVENYQECLHCPVVHPELVRLVPVYRRGSAADHENSWGVPLAKGATSLTKTGKSGLPPLASMRDSDMDQVYGCFVFPNLFLDISADCVTWDAFLPEAPGRTVSCGGYMFDPKTIANPDFDPSGVIELGNLVTEQDYAVCERVQKGMNSSAYAQGGVLTFNDRFVSGFVEHYLAIMQEPCG